MVAVADTVSRIDAIIYSKPQPTERLVLARFIAAYAQVLCVLTALFAGAIVGRLLTGDGMLGAAVYPRIWLGSAQVLFFAAAASFFAGIGFPGFAPSSDLNAPGFLIAF